MTSKSNKKSEKFWIEDPCILFTNFCMFNPFIVFNNKPLSNVMNSLTRLIIICMIVIFSITKNLNYIYIGIIIILIFIVIYYMGKNESFLELPNNGPFLENPNINIHSESKKNLDNANLPRRHSDFNNTHVPINNPLKNVKITDYDIHPEYSKATLSDSRMNKFVNGKYFQTSDQWIFDKQTQPYYTMPNSSVPNDQVSFANWLYGTENICKEGSIYMNRPGGREEALVCNGFNVATPTNFGNLNDYVPPEN